MKSKMRISFIFMSVVCGLLFSGCISENVNDTDKASIQSILEEGKLPIEILKEARAKEAEKDYLEAAKKYSLVAERTYVHEELEEAVIGRARSLLLSGKIDAALVSLDPLNDDPNTYFECQKLALAGRILSAKNNFKDAESAYEVAIGKCPRIPQTELFRAEGFAALGQVYIHNEKFTQAIRVFTVAEQLFIRQNCKEKASACAEIIRYIKKH